MTRDALLSRLCAQTWPFGPLLDALQLTPTLNVLDIGAGDGALLARLRRRGHTGVIHGLDPQAVPGIQTGYAENLPFPEAHFDVVFFVRTLLHVADPARALAEARRVLRPGGQLPGGQLIVAVQGAQHLASFWEQYGPPEEGADAATARLLPGQDFRRLDLRLPVTLRPQDAWALAASYDLPEWPVSGALFTDLHLTVFIQTLSPTTNVPA